MFIVHVRVYGISRPHLFPVNFSVELVEDRSPVLEQDGGVGAVHGVEGESGGQPAAQHAAGQAAVGGAVRRRGVAGDRLRGSTFTNYSSELIQVIIVDTKKYGSRYIQMWVL